MQIVLRADIPLYPQHCRKLAAFMEANSLDPSSVHAFIIGDESTDVSLVPAASATILTMEFYRKEDLLEILSKDDLTLLPGSHFGDALAVSLAARQGGSSMTDVLRLDHSSEEGLLIEKKVYSGHMLGSFLLQKKPYVIAIDAGHEEGTSSVHTDLRETHSIAASLPSSNRSVTMEEPTDDLTEANFIIACGRGIRNTASAELVLSAGEELGAAVGGTRPAVLNGWFPMNRLIGVSKNIAHPDVCLVLAASGSPAFYTGIEKSKFIIAVNNNELAPIFKKADLCIVADWKEFLTNLMQHI